VRGRDGDGGGPIDSGRIDCVGMSGSLIVSRGCPFWSSWVTPTTGKFARPGNPASRYACSDAQSKEPEVCQLAGNCDEGLADPVAIQVL
jgi:hypothetical protein